MKGFYLTWVLFFTCTTIGLAQSYSITTINSGFEQCPSGLSNCAGKDFIYPPGACPAPGNGGGCYLPGWRAISVGAGKSESRQGSSPSCCSSLNHTIPQPFSAGDPAPIEIWESSASYNLNLYDSNGNGLGTINHLPPGPTPADPTGKQFIELNSDRETYVYQDYSTPCPTNFKVSFYHRGRDGVDVCKVSAGPIGGPYTDINLDGTNSPFASDGNAAWGLHSGLYTVPINQTTTRFRFEAVSAANGKKTVGNFLDDIQFTAYMGIVGNDNLTTNCTSDVVNILVGGYAVSGVMGGYSVKFNGTPDNSSIVTYSSGPQINGNANISIGGFTNGPGVYTITFNTSCGGNYPVTINVLGDTPLTPNINSNSPVLQGDNIQLSTSQTGVTYAWTGPNGFYSNQQNPVIANAGSAQEGLYQLITSSSAGGCPSSPVTTYVAVTLIPNFPEPANVCDGSTLILKTTTVADEYIWRSPDDNQIPNSSLSQTIVFATADVSMAGVYSLQVRKNGILSGVATATIQVFATEPAPNINPDLTVLEGNSIQLSTTTVIANGQYQWTGPNGFSSTSQNPTLYNATQAQNGSYTLTIKTNGCQSLVATTLVTVKPLTPTIWASAGCEGLDLLLISNNAGPNMQYNWIGPSGNIIGTTTVNTLTISNTTAAMSGNYGIYITSLITGNTSGSTYTTVAINPLPATPTINPIATICNGTDLILSSPTIAQTYVWFGPNNFWSNGGSSITISSTTAAMSGTYTLIVYDNNCPSAPASIYVPVYPIPTIQAITSNSPACSGREIIITASVSPTGITTTYAWQGPLGNIVGSSNSPTLTLADATTAMSGTYTLLVAQNGCTSTLTSTIVQVHATPITPTINPIQTVVCTGNSITLSTTPISGVTYFWTGPGVNLITNSNTATIVIPAIATASAGTYTYSLSISVDSYSYCSSPVTSTTIQVNPSPIIQTLSSNSPVCSGNNIVLSSTAVAASAVSYTWSYPDGTPIPNSSNSTTITIPNSTTAMSGLYSLQIYTADGCPSAVTSTFVQVNQTPSTPTISINPSAPVCAGESVILSTTPIVGATYTWSGVGITAANASAITLPTSATAAMSGTYSYSLIVSINNCPSLAGTISISIKSLPVIQTITAPALLCTGKVLSLDTDPVLNASYQWEGPNGFSSILQSPTVSTSSTLDLTGTYTLTILVDNCSSLPKSTYVEIVPLATADAGSDLIITEDSSQKINATISGALSYEWSPKDYLDNYLLLDPTVINPQSDIMYTLSATNKAGCTTRDFVWITVPIEVPHTLIPDRDPWIIKGITGNPDSTVEIFNRWGVKVFISTGYATPWDGTDMTTKLALPTGTYYYVIDPKHGKSIVSGYVAIIR